MLIYCDNAKLAMAHGSAVPNIIVVGALALVRQREAALIGGVREVKKELFGDAKAGAGRS